MTDRLLAVGHSTCERRGYEVTDPGKPWLPPRLAEPTSRTTPFVSGAVTSRVAVEPLTHDELTPTILVSRLRNNRGNERFSLFVVGDVAAARTIRTALHEPPLVAAEDADGRRTFYAGPDRVPLAGGGYAAVRTDSDEAALVWREEGDGDAFSLLLVDTGVAATADRPGVDGAVVASLDGVDSLCRPDAAAFPYSYARDPTDKRFRISTSTGRTVGVYDGVAAMRANAYVPVPMPLVPEHVFDGIASVRDEWAVLVADDTDGREPTASAVVTADGVVDL
jgi:hypothetical protein